MQEVMKARLLTTYTREEERRQEEELAKEREAAQARLRALEEQVQQGKLKKAEEKKRRAGAQKEEKEKEARLAAQRAEIEAARERERLWISLQLRVKNCPGAQHHPQRRRCLTVVPRHPSRAHLRHLLPVLILSVGVKPTTRS
jgi:hypothetical protein